jgi:hypothetical protein
MDTNLDLPPGQGPRRCLLLCLICSLIGRQRDRQHGFSDAAVSNIRFLAIFLLAVLEYFLGIRINHVDASLSSTVSVYGYHEGADWLTELGCDTMQ